MNFLVAKPISYFLFRKVLLIIVMMIFFQTKVLASLSVGVSIKPLHSLVAAVMEGVGVPFLIIKGTGSEHGYYLHPEEAKNLANADIVFFVNENMETFLVKSLQTLAINAEKVALSEAQGITILAARKADSFEKHNHNKEDHHYRHLDFHFWLDPQNAKAAVSAIAKTLCKKDPQNAILYQKNADNFRLQLDNLILEIDQELAKVRGRHFIVFHDAYLYFEKRFGIPASGSITISPAQVPGAKRITEIREKIKSLDSVCVFSEPQFEPRIVQTVIENTNARTAELDPLGFNIPEGAQHYFTFIRKLAFTLKNCLENN